MSGGARRNRARNDRGRRVSGSPKNEKGTNASFHAVLRLAGKDVMRMATLCQERYETRDNALRHVRYENAAAAVQIFYNTLRSKRYREDFADDFDSVFGRELNSKKMLRECCLFTYGKRRASAAGTDATALRVAVRYRVKAADIPEYIENKGGLERLRRSKKRRDERPKLVAQIDARRHARFDGMKVNQYLYAKIKKVRGSSRGKPTFEIVGVRSRWDR